MDDKLILRNNLKEVRTEKKLSQAQLAEMVGVSRNTISSIETGQYQPTAKLALILCIALDKKFEDLFFFSAGITSLHPFHVPTRFARYSLRGFYSPFAYKSNA